MVMALSAGCAVKAPDDGPNTGLQALAWSPPTQGIDTDSGLSFTPRIAVEPDPADNGGGGTVDDGFSSAMAVWVERIDTDVSDLLPEVYHIMAKRAVNGVWPLVDVGCPMGNPDPTGNDGVCLIDTGSLLYDAWGPQVAIDQLGNAMVVWQEYLPADSRIRVHARRYVSGTGWDAALSTLDATSMGTAVSPEIAMEPDGGGTAFAVWVQQDSGATGQFIKGRRFTTAGVWATADATSGCTAVGIHEPDDGICDIDGGAVSNPYFAYSPRIGMDAAGQATAAYIRFDPVSCNQSLPGEPGGGPISITCKASRVYATRYDLVSWGEPLNQTPVQTFDDTDPENPNENCEDIGGDKREDINGSSACLNVGELHLAMDSAGLANGGNAVLAFKTFERALLTNAEIDDGRQAPFDLLDSHIRKSIFTVRYSGSAGTWSAPSRLSDYQYSPNTNDTLTTECDSLNTSDTEDFVVAMNCNFWGITVAVKPDDGTRAMLAYERYVGPVGPTPSKSDIVVHRYNGTAFGSVADADDCTNAVGTCWHNVDAGAGDAHAPDLALDNNGNAMLVWTQKNAGGDYHVYANRCASDDSVTTGECLWDGPVRIDAGVAGEEYFEPHVAMEAVNATNASAADCAGSGGVSCGDALTLINTMDSLFNFSLDSSNWTPP